MFDRAFGCKGAVVVEVAMTMAYTSNHLFHAGVVVRFSAVQEEEEARTQI